MTADEWVERAGHFPTWGISTGDLLTSLDGGETTTRLLSFSQVVR